MYPIEIEEQRPENKRANALLTNDEMLRILSILSRNDSSARLDPSEFIALTILKRHQKMFLPKLRYVLGLPWSKFNKLMQEMARKNYIYFLAVSVNGEYHHVVMISFEGRNYIESIDFSVENIQNICLEL